MFFDKLKLGVYNVGIIEKSARDIINSDKKIKIRWVKHKYRDRFFADPFLFSVDEDYYYILAEEFPFYTNKGVISMLTVDRRSMKLKKRKTVIEEDVHLSYPLVYNDEIIPESFRCNKVNSYKLDDEYNVVSKTTILEHGLIDQTFLVYEGKEWIFATDADNKLYGLKIFYRDIGSDVWHEHKKSPVKSDITNSRPGGKFFELNGKIYRPVQDSEKLYGHRIRIMELQKLSETEFEEKEVKMVSSEGNKPYDMGFHTFNAEDGFVVVDGYREYTSLFIKPMSIKLSRLMKFFGERICK